MVPKEPQPRVEGVSLSGVMASACLLQADSWEGAYITGQATSDVATRRIFYDTEARSEAWLPRSQCDRVRARL